MPDPRHEDINCKIKAIDMPGQTDESGIGLAIVKKIAGLHGAKIEMNDPRGHTGLIVSVVFPLA